MGTGEPLAVPVHSAREALAVAEELAQRHIEAARASSVALDVDAGSEAVDSIDVGLFAYRRRVFGGTRLWRGFVQIDNRARRANFQLGGEYATEQLAQLSAVPGSGFPPEALDLDSVALDVRDVLRLAAERLALKGTSLRLGGPIHLLLGRSDGRSTWRIQREELDGLGVYVLVVDASTNEITYERLPPGAA